MRMKVLHDMKPSPPTISKCLQSMVLQEHARAVYALINRPPCDRASDWVVVAGSETDARPMPSIWLDGPYVTQTFEAADADMHCMKSNALLTTALRRQEGFVGFAWDLIGCAIESAPCGVVTLQQAVRALVHCAVVFDTWAHVLIARDNLRHELSASNDGMEMLAQLHPFVSLDGSVAEVMKEYAAI